jgi:hypothetical protein
MVLLQAKHFVEKLIPPGWQHEQACSVCKPLFDYAIYGIYECFHHVVFEFIWVVYLLPMHLVSLFCQKQ